MTDQPADLQIPRVDSNDIETAAPSTTDKVIKHESHTWMLALLTSAHYGLPEYEELRKEPPPGGISALASLALTGLIAMGSADGLSPEDTIFAFACQTAGAMDE